MIKLLFNVFKRDQKSIKYIKMSKTKKILLSLVVCALILFAMSSILMPIVMNADKIIVLNNGQIVGLGTHDELMDTCEVYREIAFSQLSKEELNHE